MIDLRFSVQSIAKQNNDVVESEVSCASLSMN